MLLIKFKFFNKIKITNDFANFSSTKIQCEIIKVNLIITIILILLHKLLTIITKYFINKNILLIIHNKSKQKFIIRNYGLGDLGESVWFAYFLFVDQWQLIRRSWREGKRGILSSLPPLDSPNSFTRSQSLARKWKKWPRRAAKTGGSPTSRGNKSSRAGPLWNIFGRNVGQFGWTVSEKMKGENDHSGFLADFDGKPSALGVFSGGESDSGIHFSFWDTPEQVYGIFFWKI